MWVNADLFLKFCWLGNIMVQWYCGILLAELKGWSCVEAHVGSLPYWSSHFIMIWLALFLLWASWISQWYVWEPHAFMFFLLSTVTISWFCSWWAQAGVCKCEISTAEWRVPEPSLPIWLKLFINAVCFPLYLAPRTGVCFYGFLYLLMIGWDPYLPTHGRQSDVHLNSHEVHNSSFYSSLTFLRIWKP